VLLAALIGAEEIVIDAGIAWKPSVNRLNDADHDATAQLANMTSQAFVAL
jgi:hypothetical protein